MPISEDEFNQYSNDSIPSSTMSKAELRKTHKPIMEKRRRAKINNCLNEIKHLILTAMKKDPERHSKLEKADILEMAVKHLKNVQKQQKEFAIRTDPTAALKFKSGFVDCAGEINNYVNNLEGVDEGLRQRLSLHLSKCATSIDYKPFTQFSSNTPSSSLLATFAQNRFSKMDKDDQNNNAKIRGIELIPGRLPSGEFAFLVPKSSFSSILSNHINEERPSAFVTVTPSSKLAPNDGLLKIARPLSPPLSPKSSYSPRGFQPVIPKNEAAIIKNQQEIQSIKFPIHIKRETVSEPLCIITNNAERYRQAKIVPESCNNEENIVQGLKRYREESLLTTPQESPKKLFKMDAEASSSIKAIEKKDDEGEAFKNNESMWRPW